MVTNDDDVIDYDVTKTKKLQVIAGEFDKLEVKRIRKNKEDFSPFSMVGPLRRANTRRRYMDIFDIVISLSKKEQELWNEIRERSDSEFGLSVMSHFEDYNKTQMNMLYRRLSSLKAAGLVLKVIPFDPLRTPLAVEKPKSVIPKKHSYMINPEHIKPFQYSAAQHIWKQLKRGYHDE